MQLASSILIKLVVGFFAWMPFRLIYILSDITAFLFIHVIGYRKTVIQNNLKNSFPSKSDKELSQIAKHFYKHLCDIIYESLKGLSMPKSDFKERFHFKNPDVFNEYFEQNQSIILLGSHYGNWEWGVLSFSLAVEHQVVGIFKKLSNRTIDEFLQKKRMKWGLKLSEMRSAGKAVIKKKSQPSIYVFIADQTPVDVVNCHWINFLNQETPFLHGAEKIARKTGYPVFQYKINRIKRGYYEVIFEPLSLNPKETSSGEITTLFANNLERQIIENPPYWLWSHRRWKRKRPDKSRLTQ